MQFFLDNLLSQRPDQQQTLAAIGEVHKHQYLFTEKFNTESKVDNSILQPKLYKFTLDCIKSGFVNDRIYLQ